MGNAVLLGNRSADIARRPPPVHGGARDGNASKQRLKLRGAKPRSFAMMKMLLAACAIAAAAVTLAPAPAMAHRVNWDRVENRIDRREDRWDRREDRWDRREDRRDAREDIRDARHDG